MPLNATGVVNGAVASSGLSPTLIYQIPLLGDVLMWWSNFTGPNTFEWTLILIVALFILKKVL